MRGKYKLLARLMDAEEYEKFISSLKKEKQLRQKIKELSKYRKNGITKLEGGLAMIIRSPWILLYDLCYPFPISPTPTMPTLLF